MGVRSVAAVLWRTLYLQTFKRHYLATGTELLVVVIVFKFISPYTSDDTDYDQRPEVGAIVYGPNTTYTNRLAELIANVSFQRYADAPHDDDDPSTNPDDSHRPTIGRTLLLGLESAEQVGTSCVIPNLTSMADARNNVSKPHPSYRLLCATFSGDAVSGVGPSLTYELLLEQTDHNGLRKGYFRDDFEETKSDAWADAFDFQCLVEDQHLLLQRQAAEKKGISADPLPEVTMEELPEWILEKKLSARLKVMRYKFYVGFIVPVLFRASNLMYEFTSGQYELQCVLGLDSRDFFVGHFLRGMIIESVHAVAVVPCLMFQKITTTYDRQTNWSNVVHEVQEDLFPNVDPSLLAATILIFLVGMVLHVMFLACLYSGGIVAYILVYLVVLYVPDSIVEVSHNSMTPPTKYLLRSRVNKFAHATLPFCALVDTLSIIVLQQLHEGRAGWGLVVTRFLHKDNITILEIWVAMLLACAVFGALTSYLCRMLRWLTTNPQAPNFFLMPSYWTRGRADEMKASDIQPNDSHRYEEMPPHLKPLVVTSKLVKVYGKKKVLDETDFTIYEGKCTVLLGHNGAGKTTLLNILAGITAPTSGNACVGGFSVVTQPSMIRKYINICQQNNVFFNDLTVEEHQKYFSKIAGAADVRESVRSILDTVRLTEKAQIFPRSLSRGERRRLALAIALVSRPKLMILDEPTTGLDPETKRRTWDVIKSIDKQHTSILLSTHDMAEADVLADHIVIMAHGKVIFSGSATFLKKACRVGYNVVLEKEEGFKLRRVLAIVKKAVPEAEVTDEKKHEVTISLNTFQTRNFENMFKELADAKNYLRVASTSVTIATMKDVYLKINRDFTQGTKEEEQLFNHGAIVHAARGLRRNMSPGRWFYALFVKQLLHLKRNQPLFLVGLLIGLIFSTFIRTSDITIDFEDQNYTSFVPLDLARQNWISPTILIGGSHCLSACVEFRNISLEQGANVRVLRERASDEAALNITKYMSTVAFGAKFDKNTVFGVFNPTRPVSKPLLKNMLSQAQLRADTGDTVAHISASFQFAILSNEYPGPLKGWTPSLIKIVYAFLITAALYFCLIISICSFLVFPFHERTSGIRELQLMCGISGGCYALCHLLFDLLVYLFVVAVWVALLVKLKQFTLKENVFLAVPLAFYGPAIILTNYLVSEYVSSVTAGFTVMMLLLITSSIASFVMLFLPRPLSYAMLLYSPAGFSDILINTFLFDAINVICENIAYFHPDSATEPPVSPSQCHERLRTWLIGELPCIIYKIGIFLFDAFLLYLILSRKILRRHLGKKQYELCYEQRKLDPDVAKEISVVEEICRIRNFESHSLVACNVHKYYGDIFAVRGISFALRPSECLGLLGVNGAGKTTILQVLAGLCTFERGEVHSGNMKLTSDPVKWQRRVGFCFQADSFINYMNAYEFLYLIGRLRGISDAHLLALVESLIIVVQLKEHATKRISVYSGGNKRKLSIAVALLGMPPVIFLDEPYAGVDVIARHKIFQAINNMKRNSPSTLLLSSHSMEECEYSCDRIAILISGQIRCLGTLQRLREKFGQGYRFEFKLRPDAVQDCEAFIAAVTRQFPGINFAMHSEDVYIFTLKEKMELSHVFSKVSKLEATFFIEHAIVGENTLEEIFVALAKEAQTDVVSGAPSTDRTSSFDVGTRNVTPDTAVTPENIVNEDRSNVSALPSTLTNSALRESKST